MKSLLRIFPGVICLLSNAAWALNVQGLHGEKEVTFKSPRGVQEKCVIPQKWVPELFSAADRKMEDKLCAQDFYSNMGVCPKYNSTNPGVLLIEPKNMSAAQITASSCDTKRLDLKVDSKFKQSVSCSYTGSILAYYQFSRLLGGAGRVPVSVIRTMDIETHRQISDKANATLQAGRNPDDAQIRATWSTVADRLKNPARFPELFDSTIRQTYGALVQNVKGEFYYGEVSGAGDYDSRYIRFQKQTPFLNVASSSSLAALAGGTTFEKVAQIAVQMKDVSDMILLDTLLNQQDRIGNIHYKYSWYYPDSSQPNGYAIEKSKTDIVRKVIDGRTKNVTVVPPEEKTTMAAKGGVLVKEMYLKDNDCGIIKTNMMRQNSIIEQVRHMSYETYARFMQLEKRIGLAETREYLDRELLINHEDYEKVYSNFQRAKAVLYGNCKKGLLKFDVDLSDYVKGGLSSKSCDI